jgi:hypothetical protein
MDGFPKLVAVLESNRDGKTAYFEDGSVAWYDYSAHIWRSATAHIDYDRLFCTPRDVEVAD